MLDERGVEWCRNTFRHLSGYEEETAWEADGIICWFVESFSLNGNPLSTMLRVAPRYDLTTEQAIAATLGPTVTGETSDGYHTFNELYHHRAVLFSVIVRDHPELAWKSKLHSDGTMYDGMFIVGIETPQGQATYHYDIEPYWEMFDCKELVRAPEWDGHTPNQAIERISTLGAGTCHLEETEHEQEIDEEFGKGSFSYWAYDCDACGHENAEYGRFCAGCGRKVVDE